MRQRPTTLIGYVSCMTPRTENPQSTAGFSTLGLDERLLASLTSLGYEEPTPVQRETIPLVLSGRDLIAQAATGTGKTAAFALPMIHRLLNDEGRAAPAGRLPNPRPRPKASTVS